jgi:hypothetical protein
MSTSNQARVSIGTKIVAVLMVFGGVSGVIRSAPLCVRLAQQPDFFQMTVAVLAIVLFAWGVRVAWGLWQGEAQFIRWAAILFALQVPIINYLGLAYEFTNGLGVRILVGGSGTGAPHSHYVNIGGNLGSWLNFDYSQLDSRWMVGINLVALIVAVYLFKLSHQVSTDLVKDSEEMGVRVENASRTDLTQ